MKKILFLTIVPGILIFPIGAVTLAQQNQSGNQNGSVYQQSSANQGTNQTQAQTQTQTQTSDQSQDFQFQITNQIQTKLKEANSEYNAKDNSVQQSLSDTNMAVQNLIKLSAKVHIQNQALASQIQTLAKEQVQTTEKISKAIDKAQTQNKFVKFFTGGDYKQINEMTKLIEQNQLRIRELNQIKTQITNKTDSTNLQNQINVLETLNTSLQDKINQLSDGFSLFGWLFSMING
jgi:hypothetical protein